VLHDLAISFSFLPYRHDSRLIYSWFIFNDAFLSYFGVEWKDDIELWKEVNGSGPC
jgi:hypothetical protein